MGNSFAPSGGVQSGLKPAMIGAARAINAPQYGARGQSIAAQKYVEAAAKANLSHAKSTKRSSAYPSTKPHTPAGEGSL